MEAVKKTCQLITALAGHEMTGMRNGQLVEATGLSPASVTQYTKALIKEGFVEEVPGHRQHWRLAPKMIQIAQAHQRHMYQAKQHIDEVNQRYSREP